MKGLWMFCWVFAKNIEYLYNVMNYHTLRSIVIALRYSGHSLDIVWTMQPFSLVIGCGQSLKRLFVPH